MHYPVFSRFLSLALVAGTVFGIAGTVFAAPGAPTNFGIIGGPYTNDTTPTFTWTPGAGATWYEILLDHGSWYGIGNTNNYTLWPVSEGWHTLYIRAHDNARGVSVAEALTFEIDTQGPTISSVTPTSTQTGVLTGFSVSTSGEAAIAQCWLYIDAVQQGLMLPASHGYTGSVTFATAGSHSAYARCVDGDGNYALGPVSTITVTKGTVTNDPGIVLSTGALIKPKCQNYEPKVGTCASVYYYGKDGAAHAFPTESVYRSWYGSSFSLVKEIETWQFNRLAIGENVTMRPGTLLMKVTGSATVYAVDENAVLRPFATEAAAQAVYGAHWKDYVVTVASTAVKDYTIGARIYTSGDYSKVKAYHSTVSIDETF